MAGCLAETGVAVIGGDLRQSMVVEELANRSAWVRIYRLDRLSSSPRVSAATCLEEAVDGAGVILFPISGVNDEERVKTSDADGFLQLPSDFLNRLEPGTLLATGSSPAEWRARCQNLNLRLLDYAELDEVAIPNAIPTAEGAIQLAMESTPVTLCRNDLLVLGFGRVARALARMLLGIGACVTVAARNPDQLETAAALGCGTIRLEEIAPLLPSMWVIFNTIPALVLTADLLRRVRRDAVIIDLASAPGGTDFAAAKTLGLKAILALGLPGKVAPRTAGEILASTIPNLIERVITH